MLLLHIISEWKYIVFNEDLSPIQTNYWSTEGKGTYPQSDDDSHLVKHTLSVSFNPLIANLQTDSDDDQNAKNICNSRAVADLECLTREKNVITTQLTKLKN